MALSPALCPAEQEAHVAAPLTIASPMVFVKVLTITPTAL